MSDKFENIVKAKVEEVNFDYNPQDWVALDSALPKAAKPWYAQSLAKIAASVVLIGSISYFVLDQDNSQPNNNENLIPLEQDEVVVQPESSSNKKESTKKSSVATDEEKYEKPVKTETNNSEPAIEEKELSKNEQISTPESNFVKESIVHHEETDVLPIETQSLKIEVQGNACLHGQITLTPNLEEEYGWTVNGEEYTESKQLVIELNEAGDYEVSYHSKSQSWDTLFRVMESRPIDFTYEDSKDLYFDEMAELTASPSDMEFHWSINALEAELSDNPLRMDFGAPGIYDVVLTGKDINGCETQIEKPVSIQTDFDPLAPNSFTPDGDGMNDDFIPLGFKNIEYESFVYYIYDSAGKLIFMADSPEKAWNGTKNNQGQKLFSEYFVWKVIIGNKGKEKSFTGKVKIMSF